MDHSYNTGGGNLYSSAEDMVRLGEILLGPDFLSAEILAQHYQPKERNGRLQIDLGGAYPGVQAGLHVLPDDDLVFSIVTNTWGIDAIELEFAEGLVDRLAAVLLESGAGGR